MSTPTETSLWEVSGQPDINGLLISRRCPIWIHAKHRIQVAVQGHQTFRRFNSWQALWRMLLSLIHIDAADD